MRVFLLLFHLLTTNVSADVIIPLYDESFRSLCTRLSGQLVTAPPSTIKNIPPKAEKCTVDWDMEAQDDEEAKQLCLDMGVFHLSQTIRQQDGFVKCVYEAILVCKIGFKQIHGKCYKLLNNGKLRRKEEAESDCASENLQLITHQNDYFDKLIGGFFENLESIWINIPGGKAEVFYTEKDAEDYMVAYSSASFFRLAYASLVKVGKTRQASAICEYTPPDTILSVKAKLEKLKPYINPVHSDGVRTYWRTWNSDDDKVHGTSWYSFQGRCQKSMSAVLGLSNKAYSLDPTKVIMKEMPEELVKSTPITAAPFRHCVGYTQMLSLPSILSRGIHNCDQMHVVGSSKYNVDCQTCYSHDYPKLYAVIYSEDGKSSSIVKSINSNIPLWCNILYTTPKSYKPCPAGWKKYDRMDGKRMCHKHIAAAKEFYYANQYCQNTYNAELSAFGEIGEYELLKREETGYIAAKKAVDCPEIKQDGECSLDHLFWFAWGDGDNTYSGTRMIAKLMKPGQTLNTSRKCVIVTPDGLEEVRCDYRYHFFCGKEAEEEQ